MVREGRTRASLRYQPSLDGIRALSVLAVMAYHADYGWARGGFLGVDAFFVLSGFLITTLLVLEFRAHNTIALGAFWVRRARRLLPALLLVLAVVALYIHRDVVSWNRMSVRNDGLASLFYVANWRFILAQQSYFTLFSVPSPFRHMWSLAIEEQFYIVWPLVVLASLKLALGSLRVLAGVCAFGIVASGVVMAATYTAADPSRAYYGTDTRAHSLLIGALLGLILLVWTPGRRARLTIAIIGALTLVALFVAWTRVSATSAGYFHGGSALFAVAVAAIIAGALQQGPLRALLSFQPLPWIGRISYGLYLWHWPIDVWLTRTRVHFSDTQLTLLQFALTFGAATASFYLVERPIRMWRFPQRRIALSFVPVVALVAAIVIVGAAGASPPPSYLVAFGHPSVCKGPSPAELQAARDAVPRDAGTARLATSGVRRVLVVGDSVACSFYTGLAAVGEAAGITVDQGSVVGCGVVSGEVEETNGEHAMQGMEICDALVERTVSRALARSNPDVVLWVSSWERFNLRVAGRTIAAGSPNGDAVLLERMEEARRRLTANGARLAFVTVPPGTEGSALGARVVENRDADRRVEHLNDLLGRFAARHASCTYVVDLARRVCPHGIPCGPAVDGRRPRPDGAHFSPAGASWAAEWLV